MPNIISQLSQFYNKVKKQQKINHQNLQPAESHGKSSISSENDFLQLEQSPVAAVNIQVQENNYTVDGTIGCENVAAAQSVTNWKIVALEAKNQLLEEKLKSQELMYQLRAMKEACEKKIPMKGQMVENKLNQEYATIEELRKALLEEYGRDMERFRAQFLSLAMRRGYEKCQQERGRLSNDYSTGFEIRALISLGSTIVPSARFLPRQGGLKFNAATQTFTVFMEKTIIPPFEIACNQIWPLIRIDIPNGKCYIIRFDNPNHNSDYNEVYLTNLDREYMTFLHSILLKLVGVGAISQQKFCLFFTARNSSSTASGHSDVASISCKLPTGALNGNEGDTGRKNGENCSVITCGKVDPISNDEEAMALKWHKEMEETKKKEDEFWSSLKDKHISPSFLNPHTFLDDNK